MFKISIKPENYKKIDKFVSRSAQPNMQNINWLKEHGVTDIINFRTMYDPEINFDEKFYVEKVGMYYHNIPSISKYPNNENVGKFLDIVEGVKSNGGQVHIHCKQGADRTGLYSYIYERLNNIGSLKENISELINHHWHIDKYPDMLNWADNFISKKLCK